MIKLNINGKVHSLNVEPDTPLLWAIREQIGLTGTKYGCGVAQCGACSVEIDGQVVRSCSMPVSAVTEKQKIVTIEGMTSKITAALQKAWLDLDVPQCGYCQSGQLMAATALLKTIPNPTDAEIKREMSNICRCGTYNRISAGIKQAASALRA